MIQRIQSLYLLLGAIVQVLFATGTYYAYRANEITYQFTGSGIINFEGEQVDGDSKNLLLGLGVALFALVTIFLFKNRKQQMKLAKIAGLASLAEIAFLIISYFQVTGVAEEGSVSIKFAAFIVPISTILFFIAHKAIKKDDDLVKSVDRIR